MEVQGLAVSAKKGLPVKPGGQDVGRQELQKITFANMRMGGLQVIWSETAVHSLMSAEYGHENRMPLEVLDSTQGRVCATSINARVG